MAGWSPAFGLGDVRVEKTDTVYEGFFSTRVLHLKHRLFNGGWSKVLTREVFCRGAAAGVIIYDPALDQVLLIEQFRPGTVRDGGSAWMLELVAGIVDPGESETDVVIREAKEEAGLVLSQVEFVMRYFPSPGGCDEQIALFAACADLSDAGGVHGLATEGEDIKVHVMPFADAMDCLEANRLLNATTIIGLQWLEKHRGRLRAGAAG